MRVRCSMGIFVALLLFHVASEAAFSLYSDRGVVKALVKANNKIGMDVHRKHSSEDDGNVFALPNLMAISLAKFFYGSRGKTAETMRTALRYKHAGLSNSQVHTAFRRIVETILKDSELKENHINVSSAAFTQKGYPSLQKYKDGLLQNYYTSAHDVDFQNARVKAVQDINDWVKRKTDNRIKKMLDDVDPLTFMVLLTTGNFEGRWETEFDPKDTSKKLFYNDGSLREKVEVEMMHLVKELRYARLGEGTVVEIPYKGQNIAAIIYLPDAINGAYEAQQNLSAQDAINALEDAQKAEVDLFIPKFTLNYDKVFNPEPHQLGFEKVFKTCYDMWGIREEFRIAVLDIAQKAFFKVNEKGAEGSGVIGVVSGNKRLSGGNKVEHKTPNEYDKEGSEASRVAGKEDGIIQFNCNHPFFVCLVDKRHGIHYFHTRVTRF